MDAFLIYTIIMAFINYPDLPALLCAILLTAFFIYVPLGMWNTRLELSPEGITHYNMGWRTYTPWYNIAGLDDTTIPILIRPKKTVLMFKEPASREISIKEGKKRGIAAIEFSWWTQHGAGLAYQGRMIPFTYFVSRAEVEHGLFNAYMHQYTPHVFGSTLPANPTAH